MCPLRLAALTIAALLLAGCYVIGTKIYDPNDHVFAQELVDEYYLFDEDTAAVSDLHTLRGKWLSRIRVTYDRTVGVYIVEFTTRSNGESETLKVGVRRFDQHSFAAQPLTAKDSSALEVLRREPDGVLVRAKVSDERAEALAARFRVSLSDYGMRLSGSPEAIIQFLAAVAADSRTEWERYMIPRRLVD